MKIRLVKTNKNKLLKTTIFFILLFFSIMELYSQDSLVHKRFFNQRNYGKYFVSDIDAPITNISLGYWTNSIEYNIRKIRDNKALIPLVEITLGTELPLLNWSKEKYSMSISLPFRFNLWLDKFEEITAPVINTDYQIGLEINYLRPVNSKSIKNLGIKFTPLMHESTHIGDEITIYRIKNNFPITRVNVSYEATEIAIQINDPLEKVEENLSFKLGAKFVLNKLKGWYYVTEEDADTLKVSDSKHLIEPYIQFQYQKPTGFLTTKHLMFVVSTDIHMRVKYEYPFYTNGSNNELIENSNSEAYIPSINFMLGWKYKNNENSLSRVGFYLRAYHGVNYHGQFRNRNQFSFFGASMIYEN